MGQPLRMDAGLKQGFVSIDVAYSRDKGLVQQQRLDAKLPALEAFQELCLRIAPVEWLDP